MWLGGGWWSTPRDPFTHFTGGWLGFRTGKEGCGKSHRHRNSIPDDPIRSESSYRLRSTGPLYIQNII